jgi:hypothetical protein
MCFSATVSYAATAVLIPAGAAAMVRAYRHDPQYLAVAALPAFFGLQQLFEGLVWTAADRGAGDWIQRFSLAYMFFTWFGWPVWVPFATYFLEPCARRHVYLVFAIFGGILGAMQFIPYFAHQGWLEVRFFDYAISYEGTVLFDLIMRRELTYLFYLSVILAPLLTSSNRSLNVFGLLILVVLGITYTFFSYAYISVFCFGGAVMSLYLVYMIFHEGGRSRLGSGTVDLDQERVPSASLR